MLQQALSNLQHLYLVLQRLNLVCFTPRDLAIPSPLFTALLSRFEESDATVKTAPRPQARMNHLDWKHVFICLAVIKATSYSHSFYGSWICLQTLTHTPALGKHLQVCSAELLSFWAEGNQQRCLLLEKV